MIDRLLLDFRFAVRRIARSPGLAMTTVAITALALGANMILFSLVNAILLRPLPGVREPDRLVNVHARREGESAFLGFSLPGYRDYRDRSEALAALAAFNGRGFSLDLGERNELVGGQLVSGNFFEVLRTRPHLGRLLSGSDDRDSNPAAVVGYGLWQRRFGGDPSLVGRDLTLNGAAFTVVGVAEEGFTGHFVGFPFEVFLPLSAARQVAKAVPIDSRSGRWLELVGRLAPGRTPEEAAAAMDALARALEREHPDTERGVGIALDPMTGVDTDLYGGVVAFLGILSAVGGLLLLIACVNIAGLLLSAAAARGREMAVRRALGAGAGSLLRQLLTETLLLACLGGAAGLILSAWTADLLHGFLPRFPIRLSFDLAPDVRVFAFSALATSATALAAGLAPAFQATRVDLVAALRSGTSNGGLGRTRARRAFVVTQVAASVLVLTGAGLFLRALHEARSLDPGFDAGGVYTTRLDVSILGRDEAQGRRFFDRLLERVEALPGVASATLASGLPVGFGSSSLRLEIEGHQTPDGEGRAVPATTVAPRYFETLGIPLLRGRDLQPSDDLSAARVLIVNDALARRYWRGEDPVGKRLWHEGEPITVVGLVGDVAHELMEPVKPHVYLPLAQRYRPGVRLFVRGSGTPEALAPPVRGAVRALDRDLALLGDMPLREALAFSLLPQRMAGTLSAGLGAAGLLLAAVGLYGLVAFHVAQRRRELAVRVALGAGRAELVGLVLREGLGLALLGVALGLAAGVAVSSTLARFLAGVSPTDPLALASVSALVVAVSVLASYLPARRAGRVDPMQALRHE